LIGAAAGALFGFSDIAVKAGVGVLGHGLVALLLSPWLALAVLGGLLAQYVSARSLQTGDAVSVTALTGLAVNVANIAGGILVFGDPLAHGFTGVLIEGTAFALICVGAFFTPVRAELTARGEHVTPRARKLPRARSRGQMRPDPCRRLCRPRRYQPGADIERRRASGDRPLRGGRAGESSGPSGLVSPSGYGQAGLRAHPKADLHVIVLTCCSCGANSRERTFWACSVKGTGAGLADSCRDC